MFRIGHGFDAHRFAKGRKLALGGVIIPYSEGLSGHSDADVLIHAIIDSILGALALGDIGQHFPDTDMQYKDISGQKLLSLLMQKQELQDWTVSNIDATVIAQKPKIAPFIPEMKETLAPILHCPASQISIKATTTEGMGFCGREEGIAAFAVALLTTTRPVPQI